MNQVVGRGSNFARPSFAQLPYAPLSRPGNELAAWVLLVPVLMLAAAVNGFPIIFYDTGAYVLQGFEKIFIAERSPVYSLFLAYAGGPMSLWYVALVQCAIVAFAFVAFVRAIKPQLSLWVLLLIGLVLTLATGLPWYAAQIEPDCFVAVVPMALYLLAFHGLGWWRNALLTVCAAFATATHSSHLGLAVGLIACLAVLRVVLLLRPKLDIARPALALPVLSCVSAFAILFACNYALTGKLFFSRAGAIFLEARMMQDGLIKPVLDADCPAAGYRICRYKDDLPARADAYLWEEKISPFFRMGGFRKMGPESALLVHESVTRYPLSNLGWAAIDTVLQFFAYPTGDGIVPQEWVLEPEFRRTIPAQMAGYNTAYQQKGYLWFLPLNLIHVPVAFLSVVALGWLIRRAARTGDWRGATLPAFVLIALLGNAFICGVFSGPHFRYQSRIMWWPALVVILLGAKEIPALRQRFESVT
ncbi:MAG TPA: hypothetical protein VG889_12595 [Rhizomicrobium sp.]|nr:hypothetical protein [Rhizomicrobium sp.]